MGCYILALGYSEPSLFVGTLRFVRVIIYERPTTDHICHIRQVIEASTSRWMFEGGMREAAREALAIL
jgi:hypothetical protein